MNREQRMELDRKYEEEKKNRVFLTQEEIDALSPEEKEEAKVRGAMLGFYESLLDNKPEDAQIYIGLLVGYGVSDIPYYSGVAKQYRKDYTGAIEEYRKIGKDSEKYDLIKGNLEAIYVHTGSYEDLCSLLALGKDRSAISAVDRKIKCLLSAVKEKTTDELEQLVKNHPLEEITYMNADDEDELHYHFSVRKMICTGLVAAGTCIHRIGQYVEKSKGKQIDFQNDPNIRTEVVGYDKTIVLLKALDSYKVFPAGAPYEEIALAHRNWKDKLSILYTGEYKSMLGKLIFSLLNPATFPQENRITIVYHLLDVLCEIDPGFLMSLLSNYWEDIETAIYNGDFFAIKYINNAYGLIMATKQDPYNLKSRLQLLIDNTPEIDPKESVKRSRIIYSLSQEGYEALVHAENQYKLNEGKMGTENASELALMFFKVFEIEYNKRLIKPLLKEIDFIRLQQLYDSSSEEWKEEINRLQDVDSTKRKMTIGEIRNLLYKILKRDGQCSNELINALYKVLTNNGIQAFLRRTMMQLISANKTDEYRNPGAHTGYMPFSKASEAKELVMTWIPVMGQWFKQ